MNASAHNCTPDTSASETETILDILNKNRSEGENMKNSIEAYEKNTTQTHTQYSRVWPIRNQIQDRVQYGPCVMGVCVCACVRLLC